MRIVCRHALSALMLLGATFAANAQDTGELEGVQQELDAGRKQAEALEKKAANLGKEVADLQAALITAAANVQKSPRSRTRWRLLAKQKLRRPLP